MSLNPNQRDESLFLQCQRFKSILESEGVVNTIRDMENALNGSKEKAGILVRMTIIENQIKALVKSNAALQKAMYIATGIYLATKFYFEYLAPHHP